MAVDPTQMISERSNNSYATTTPDIMDSTLKATPITDSFREGSNGNIHLNGSTNVSSSCNTSITSTISNRSNHSHASSTTQQHQRRWSGSSRSAMHHHHSSNYDPMRILSAHQLEAFEFLVSTPIWIFDFVQRKNRWANAAGLKLWNAPNLEEFLNRDMSEMSHSAQARAQKTQHRIEQGQIVQDQWTFYPKGKARTVNLTMTAVRLHDDEDHCSMFVSGTTMGILPAASAKATAAARKDEEEKHQEEDLEDVGNQSSSSFIHDNDDFHRSDHDGECINTNPIYQETLRVTEILRHLPTAVCQFDMKGEIMFENPAAFLPLDDDVTSIDDSKVCKEDTKCSDEDFLFGGDGDDAQLLLSSGKRSLINRFVDRKVAEEVLQKLQQEKIPSSPINIEAELYTNQKGRTQWSAIQLHKTLDPVTSQPVILYSSRDRSDAIEAKREREARIEKAEFLAIMAHEIRTPLVSASQTELFRPIFIWVVTLPRERTRPFVVVTF
jgi:hypothetical protein